MRIVVAVKYYPPMKRVSGIVGFLSVLLRKLGEQHEVHVVTHRPVRDPQRSATINNVVIHRVRGSFPIAAARQARALDADVVLFVSGIFTLRLAAPYYAVFSALVGRRVPRMFMQATHPDSDPGRLMVTALTGTKTILATSPDIAESFRTVCGDRVDLFQPAVDLPPDRSDIDAPDRPVRIGFINHFNQVKGADIAVSAVQAALEHEPSASAIFAGTGDLEALIASSFATEARVDLRGFVEEEERLELIRSCDIMVLPFRQAVSVLGVSQTVLEVMAARRVVVGTPTASITPAIVNDSNGVLADLDRFTDELVSLVTDRARRNRLGNQARADAVSTWGIDQRVADFVDSAVSAQRA